MSHDSWVLLRGRCGQEQSPDVELGVLKRVGGASRTEHLALLD
jgi:hypothetical protein